ncbi:hypothetical protein CH370_11530 [Leptospira kmetyi]|uniref:hypothetical protein n=1 Tax=Leptospira kmetyi TaxID=408139 RepID=UPI0002895077|nr:hypothetical protein [Leptospira kmetyi]EQA53938.1 hypothetical protein LEP1GSC052_3136 [Leptospira kmetyi serovar Malaysia str. Bejo-Iso9]PJZ41418.1 hypothetical protein CH370_11530 [Leptospira kmetyi]TGL66744.1 hypothetical protein EHQ67_15485 [Leptospira kmetyi]
MQKFFCILISMNSEKKILRSIYYPRKFYLELMDANGVFIGTPLKLIDNRIQLSVDRKFSSVEGDRIHGAIYGVKSRESCTFVGRVVSRLDSLDSIVHSRMFDHSCVLELETEEFLPPGIRMIEDSF